MPWEPPEIETDEDAVAVRILDGLTTRLDGYEPVEGDPLAALAAEAGREIALLNTRTVQVLDLAIAGLGETAFGFPADPGAQAAVEVLLTVIAAGAVVPDGFTVVGINSDGAEVAFQLPAAVVAADTTIAVTMTAAETGVIGNAVPAGDLTIVTATATVVSAAAVGPSTGGADPEQIDSYLDRLRDYLVTLRPGGVRGDDLAALARSVPGVHRALGVDLYDPADPATPAERTATVFPVAADGLPVSAPTAAQVEAVLAASREVNFIIHVEDPTFTPVAIEYAAVAETGADPAVVESSINGAVTDWLMRWGSTDDDETAWLPDSTMRYLQLARIAGSAPGVAYLESITINGVAGDYELPGTAALPTSPLAAVAPSTVSGTVT